MTTNFYSGSTTTYSIALRVYLLISHYYTFVGFKLTTGSWVAVLSTDGSTCKVLEVAKVGIVVVTNLVWWGWGEENEEDGLIDIDGDLVDGWREDTDCEGDDINTADAIPDAVEDADDDTKSGGWETFSLDSLNEDYLKHQQNAIILQTLSVKHNN